MPDVSLLQPLCEILGISLNELFSGEHISPEEYRGKAEENISRLFQEKQNAYLKPMRSLYSVCACVTALVTAIECAVGLAAYFFKPAVTAPLLYNAAVWFVLFLASGGKLLYDRLRLNRLRRRGICVQAQVTELLPSPWFRVMNGTTGRVTCRFAWGEAERRGVSGNCVFNPFTRREDLCAVVYLDAANPMKNAVALFQKDAP